MFGGLRGRRILITRPKTQGGRLQELLRGYGAEVLWVPAIETIALPPDDEAKALLLGLGRFDWVAFTSENSLKYFLQLLAAEGLALSRRTRVASVGAATSRACQEAGLVVHAQPAVFTGADLGRLLAGEYRPGRLLLPRGTAGREDLAQILGQAGWAVETLTCYHTRPAPIAPQEIWKLEQGLDAALFASPSAVKALWEALSEIGRDALRKAVLLPIGPSTAEALRDLGLTPAAPPKETTSNGLVAALLRHFGGEAPPSSS
jgi:uroporphyrinogen-III synthase